jgi:hypothetical protein
MSGRKSNQQRRRNNVYDDNAQDIQDRRHCRLQDQQTPRAAYLSRLICRSPASVGAYLAFARVEVIALLTDHRAVVLAVADALVARRTLSGTEIDSIIDTEMSA